MVAGAFVTGWQQLHQLRSSTSVLPWLRQIARPRARDWLRAQRGRPLTGEAAEVALGMAAAPAPGGGGPRPRTPRQHAFEDLQLVQLQLVAERVGRDAEVRHAWGGAGGAPRAVILFPV
ncbi:hypothetical protein G6F64_014317 [Rhizopus arrhizus]|uniref:Uncharacterized protein n=1 Tax=Rhizopus oryzae TaxID=64495 RepID=A0A9P6WTM9_RHIOR|nr:hypothetical protein G6F64_014317 [Rhizopus arrhizus]